MDQEANYFAMCLLMPEQFVREELKKKEFNLMDDKAITELAKRFQVPVTVMTVRLIQLNLKPK